MKTIKEKIEDCKTMPELDELRLEVVTDKINFIENQNAFIKKKNKLDQI